MYLLHFDSVLHTQMWKCNMSLKLSVELNFVQTSFGSQWNTLQFFFILLFSTQTCPTAPMASINTNNTRPSGQPTSLPRSGRCPSRSPTCVASNATPRCSSTIAASAMATRRRRRRWSPSPTFPSPARSLGRSSWPLARSTTCSLTWGRLRRRNPSVYSSFFYFCFCRFVPRCFFSLRLEVSCVYLPSFIENKNRRKTSNISLNLPELHHSFSLTLIHMNYHS